MPTSGTSTPSKTASCDETGAGLKSRIIRLLGVITWQGIEAALPSRDPVKDYMAMRSLL